MKIPALIAVAALMLTGCSNLPPLTKELPSPSPTTLENPQGMRAATQQERVVLGKLGTLADDAPAFAVDLIEGRVLASAKVTVQARTFPVMIVTDGQRIANVSCDWNGDGALGVDTDRAGRMAVRSTQAVFGDELCESPYKPTPTPTTPAPKKVNGKCQRMTKNELAAATHLFGVGGVIRFTDGILVRTTTKDYEAVFKMWTDPHSDANPPGYKPDRFSYRKFWDGEDGVWHRPSAYYDDSRSAKAHPAARDCARAAGWID